MMIGRVEDARVVIEEFTDSRLREAGVEPWRGDLQHCHQRRVPREPAVTEPRINLTFRRIVGERPGEIAPHTMTAATREK